MYPSETICEVTSPAYLMELIKTRWRYSVSAYAKHDVQKNGSTIILGAAWIFQMLEIILNIPETNTENKKMKQKLLFDCSYCYIFLFISLLLYNYRSFQFWIDWPRADCVQMSECNSRARYNTYCVMKL